jgi:hypothetical protein
MGVWLTSPVDWTAVCSNLTVADLARLRLGAEVPLGSGGLGWYRRSERPVRTVTFVMARRGGELGWSTRGRRCVWCAGLRRHDRCQQ